MNCDHTSRIVNIRVEHIMPKRYQTSRRPNETQIPESTNDVKVVQTKRRGRNKSSIIIVRDDDEFR